MLEAQTWMFLPGSVHDMVIQTSHPIPSHRVSLVPLLVSSLPLVAFPEREMKLLDGPPVQPSPVGPSVQAFLVGPRGKARGWSQGDAHAESLNEAGALHPSLTSLRGWSPVSCQ